MTAEIRFSKIRTNRAAKPMFPTFISSVEDAIDHMQELPLGTLEEPHWLAAKEALWRAIDNRTSAEIVDGARIALCGALAADGWLNDLRAV